MPETISHADRDRMADDLERLHLYAVSNDVRKGRSSLTEGVNHVADHCVPHVERAIERLRQRQEANRPKPGTWGWTAIPRAEARRDEFMAFLADWSLYNFPAPAGSDSTEGGRS